MFEDVVCVVDDDDAEVGHVAVDAADVEAGGGGVAERGRGSCAVKTAKVERPVWLKFSNLFSSHW